METTQQMNKHLRLAHNDDSGSSSCAIASADEKP